jgi:hypothetical protein
MGTLKISYIFVLSGLTTRPTVPSSLLNSSHSSSRPGRLLAVTKMSSAYPQISVSLYKIVLIFPGFQGFVKNEVE